jgi:hypothetical protein
MAVGMERIKVTVEQLAPGRVWAYRKPDSKWTILNVLLESGQKFTAKGIVEFEPKHGDLLELEGEWIKSKYPGTLGKDEFCFKTAMLHVPSDPRALLHYAATLTKGIGPVKETEIWERYGAKWVDADKLDIHGISEAVEWNWQETRRRLNEHANQTQAITMLLAKGATLNMANAAWAKWEHDTVGVVSENCYRLADLPHYGFNDVDESIRVAFGIKDGDQRRVEAAILYVMGQMTSQGDTVVGWVEATAKVCEMVPDAKYQMDAAVKALIDRGMIVVLQGDKLAMSGDAAAETMIWNRFSKVY